MIRAVNVAAAFYAPEQLARDLDRDRAFKAIDRAHALRAAARHEWKRKTDRVAQRDVLSESSPDSIVRQWARRRACEAQVLAGNEPDDMLAYCRLREFVTRWHVGDTVMRLPKLAMRDGVPLYRPWIARATCRRWWTRAARVMLGRGVEGQQIDAGRVHRRAGKYVSDRNAERCQQQAQRNAQMLLDMDAENELGERVSLADMAKASISNPWIRFCEMMVLLKGLETTAQAGGWSGLFLTQTLASEYHARLSGSCAKNPAYNGHRPRDGAARLQSLWARARALVKKWGVEWFGLRVAEPHHDGTPHWHLLIWVRPCEVERVLAMLRGLALEDAPDEPGAAEHRFKVERIRAKDAEGKGGAASYLAKYVAKMTTGGQGTASERGADGERRDMGKPSEAAQRARWWASLHGIRQFQFFGIPPRGVWREARRIREPLTAAELKQAGPAQVELFERVRVTADTSDYAGHVEAMGGVAVPRASMRVVLLKRNGEGVNPYGEENKPRTAGLRLGSTDVVHVVTRLHVWTIKPARAVGAHAPIERAWTRGNNCNGPARAGLSPSASVADPVERPEWWAAWFPEDAQQARYDDGQRDEWAG